MYRSNFDDVGRVGIHVTVARYGNVAVYITSRIPGSNLADCSNN